MSKHTESFLRIRRFATVGVINTATDAGLFFIFVWLTGHVIVSNVVSYTAGASVSFLLNRSWTFAGRSRGPVRSQIVKFILLNIATLTFSTVTLAAAATVMPLVLAKAVSVLLAAVFSYLGMRLLVF